MAVSVTGPGAVNESGGPVIPGSENVEAMKSFACINCVLNGSIKCLGIHMCHDKILCEKQNWKTEIADIEKPFNNYKETILGKYHNY